MSPKTQQEAVRDSKSNDAVPRQPVNIRRNSGCSGEQVDRGDGVISPSDSVDVCNDGIANQHREQRQFAAVQSREDREAKYSSDSESCQIVSSSSLSSSSEVADDDPAGLSAATKIKSAPTEQSPTGKRKKRSSRCKFNCNSDNNNNDLDGDVDSSDGADELDDTFDSFGVTPPCIHTSNQAKSTTAAEASTQGDYNGSGTDSYDTGSSIRRRNMGKQQLHDRWRQCNPESGEHFIGSTMSTTELADTLETNLNEQQQQQHQRHKKQKLKIMKADYKLRSPTSPGRNHNGQSSAANIISELSKDDSDDDSWREEKEKNSYPLANQSSHPISAKCSQWDDLTVCKSLSLIKSLLTVSFYQQEDPINQSNLNSPNQTCTKPQDKEKSNNNGDLIDAYDTNSSATDEESDRHPPNMSGEASYRTFKGPSERRLSRGAKGSRPPRESHRRLSQTFGYSKLDHHHYQLTADNKYSYIHELKRIALLLVIILTVCLLLWQVYELLLDGHNFLGFVKTPSLLGQYKSYAVSTDAEPCANTGSNLLAKGGSAVDAAIGTLLCMGVVLPNSLGIGGGCLMTIYDAKKKEAVVIDGRETAPDYAEENMYANDSLAASRGPLSVGVPGELAAYWEAHKMFGKLKWSELFDDAIKFADQGFPMVEHLAHALKTKEHSKYMTPSLTKLFTNSDGKPYQQGELFVQPALAKTLERIRDFGALDFYEGETGQNFINDLKNHGGKMTLKNLAQYRAIVRPPLKQKLADDLVLHTQPPPGSGIVLSIILRVMHRLGYYRNLKPQVSFEAASLYYHRLVESFKFAYGQRAGLEDMPDNPERMKQLMDKLLSDEFIKEIASKVDNKTHDNAYYGGLEYFSEDHGTAHVSVVDAEGNAAAVSTSVNLYFGAGMYSPSTGIVYNDVMDDFVSPHLVNKFGLAPSKYNRIRPGKRPLSSMAPSVFTDDEGNVKLVIGGAGGAKITTAIASVSIRNCFLGEDIKTSIDGPRVHHQFLPNKLYYEVNFPKDLVHSFHELRNHTTEPILGRSSVIMGVVSQLINNQTRLITANSDYRKGGTVHGL